MNPAGRALSTFLIAVMVVGVGGFVWAAFARGLTWNDVTQFALPRNGVIVAEQRYVVPEPTGDGSRLLPQVIVAEGGTYEMWYPGVDGDPVRYDPCEPVEWVYNPGSEPEGGAQIVADAVQRVSDATGLLFVYEGETEEPLSDSRDAIQERYGVDRYAPVVIGWSDSGALAALEGTVVGVGGSSVVPAAKGDGEYLAAGSVVIDVDDAQDLLDGFDGDAVLRAVIMHELAHVVGLAHVDDEAELMSPANRWKTEWGPGDRTALALAGSGACQS